MPSLDIERSVDLLNSFLRSEIAGVETYFQAMAAFADNPGLRQQLRECQLSHQMRVDALRSRITRHGGEPAYGSGPWGAFARAFESASRTLGQHAAVAALAAGEDQGRASYTQDLAALDPDNQRFITATILPEQEHTCDLMNDLRQAWGGAR